MDCPVCGRRIRITEMIFSGLPFWITCRGCKAKLTLQRQGLFWVHFSLLVAQIAVTAFILRPVGNPVLASVLTAEALVYVVLLLTVLLPLYGLRPIG